MLLSQLSSEDFNEPSEVDFFSFFAQFCAGFHGKMNKTALNTDEICESTIKAVPRHHGEGTDVPALQTLPV